MTKYIKSQTRKMLSAYGGVGSILETTKGALIIEDFDKWYYHASGSYNKLEYEIEDNRLLERLQFHFTNLEKLVRVPPNQENFRLKTVPIREKEVASAKYFPEWMYCPNCKRFKSIKQWWSQWKNTLERYKISGDKIKEDFIQPKCYYCYDQVKSGKKKGRMYHNLEQVRFIMTSPSGEIKDIPWYNWTTIEKDVKDEDAEGGNIKFNEPCCDIDKQDLRYLQSDKFSDFAGVRIKCENPECPTHGREVTLAGLFGMRIGKDPTKQLKPVIRTSNSVYYPLSMNSIYLPKRIQEIKPDHKTKIRKLIGAGTEIGAIYIAFEDDYDKQTIDDFIEYGDNVRFVTENQYRLKEYKFIIENPNHKDNNNLTFENQETETLSKFAIDTLIKIKRLKLTTVQTGYTRQEPLDKDLFMSGEDKESAVTVKYTSTSAVNTSYLLATESFGEGIFIDFDKTKIDTWFNKHYSETPTFSKRIEDLKEKIAQLKAIPKSKFEDNLHIAKFILVHTFSHILIKELEFLCGYSATSLNERLFVDDENMQGLLIYTVAGSEGSYGGLTSQASPKSLEKILNSALFRCKDCASDPVCFHSDGQGIGGLNLAACYSCALLPETSCEEFNSFLDRAMLIDKDFGFFEV